MLIQMRTKVAKVFVFILFALLILSFAVWGIGDIFRAGGTVGTVAQVGDTEINQQEFARSLSREMNALRQRFGGDFDISHARALGIVDQVIQQLVTRALFAQQARNMGLTVTQEQIKKRILEEPAFQNSLGDFERSRFYQILNSNNLTEQQFVSTLGRDIERQHIVEAVIGVTDAPRGLAEALYRYQQERRTAETVLVPRAKLPEDTAPTEEQVEKTYRANAAAFMAPEYRAVTFISLDAADLAKDIAIGDEVLREEFESRRGEFNQPERRSIEQMVLGDQETANRVKERLAAGESFAEVSQALLNREPVDLGRLTRESLTQQLPDVVDQVFALAAGEVSEPVKSPFGWHLLRVVEIEPPREPGFEAVKAELQHDLAMREAVESMLDRADGLEDELASGASLEEAAATLKLSLKSVPALDSSGRDKEGAALSGLPAGPAFLRTVFETDAGETSLLTETRDGNYFVVRVDSVTEATPRPLAEVREQVVELWRNDERDRLSRERAEELAARANEGVALSAVAQSEDLVFSKTDPVTREWAEAEGSPSRALAARLFEMEPGEIAVVATPEGQVVTKLVEIQRPDPAADPDAVERLRETLGQSLQNDLLSGFVSVLRNEIGVRINERVVEATTATF